MRNVKERKIRVFMGFTVMERPGESGEKDVGGGGIKDSVWSLLPLRRLQDSQVEMDTRVQRLHVSAGSSAPRPVSTSQVPDGG